MLLPLRGVVLLLRPLLWSKRGLTTLRRRGLRGGYQGWVLGRRSSSYPPSSLLDFILGVVRVVRVVCYVQQTHA